MIGTQDLSGVPAVTLASARLALVELRLTRIDNNGWDSFRTRYGLSLRDAVGMPLGHSAIQGILRFDRELKFARACRISV